MADRKQNEEDGLKEIHRLLKKFSTIREQRAKKSLQNDLIAKTNNKFDTKDHNQLTQLQDVNQSNEMNALNSMKFNFQSFSQDNHSGNSCFK
uniref:Bm13592 n=1 Tax=Brugia malayi TaxID=6279 RepID=A0A0J9YG08_BRUMA|nr:Bm13592 [Brugia malayi]